jgi:curved DNA-binding protein CbpA
MEKTYYEKFGIKENASLLEIKRAYRKLALKYHPDRNGGDKKAENIFKQVNNIYETLSDIESRKKYDVELNRKRDTKRHYTSTSHSYQKKQSYQQTYNSQKQETNYSSGQNSSSKRYETVEKDYSGYVILVTVGVLFFAIYFSSSTTNISSKSNSSSSDYNSSSINSNYSIENSPATGEINFGSSKPKKVLLKDTVNIVSSNPNIYKQPKTNTEKKEPANSQSTGEIKF